VTRRGCQASPKRNTVHKHLLSTRTIFHSVATRNEAGPWQPRATGEGGRVLVRSARTDLTDLRTLDRNGNSRRRTRRGDGATLSPYSYSLVGHDGANGQGSALATLKDASSIAPNAEPPCLHVAGGLLFVLIRSSHVPNVQGPAPPSFRNEIKPHLRRRLLAHSLRAAAAKTQGAILALVGWVQVRPPPGARRQAW
jgi:hypothetical protein